MPDPTIEQLKEALEVAANCLSHVLMFSQCLVTREQTAGAIARIEAILSGKEGG